MEMTGEQTIPASQEDTWKALNDPDILKACVPGCESITRVSDNEYQVQMTAKVGPVSAKFRGRLSLFDINAPQSYSLAFEGQGGAAGFAKGTAQVNLAPLDARQTKLTYNAKANVGGKLAQIGSRLVDAAARKVADEFFQNFTRHMSAGEAEQTVITEAEAEHHSAADDPAMPSVSNTTLMFFAAGVLVVFIVALVAFFG